MFQNNESQKNGAKKATAKPAVDNLATFKPVSVNPTPFKVKGPASDITVDVSQNKGNYKRLCKNCGNELEEGSDFCKNCGTNNDSSNEEIDTLRKSIESDPNNAEAWDDLAEALADKNDFSGAIDAYHKAIEIDPSNQDTWADLADLLVSLEDFGGAIYALRNAIEIDPNDESLLIELGNALVGNKDYEEAITTIQKALTIDPKDRSAWVALGTALEAKQDINGAIDAYRNEIALDPYDVSTWHRLGLAQYEQGDFTGAIGTFEQAVASNPNDSKLWYNLGLARVELRNFAGAVEAFQWAVSLDPNDTDAKQNLDLARRDQGIPANTTVGFIPGTMAQPSPSINQGFSPDTIPQQNPGPPILISPKLLRNIQRTQLAFQRVYNVDLSEEEALVILKHTNKYTVPFLIPFFILTILGYIFLAITTNGLDVAIGLPFCLIGWSMLCIWSGVSRRYLTSCWQNYSYRICGSESWIENNPYQMPDGNSVEPKIIVPIDLSPVGLQIPPGQTVLYSTIAKVNKSGGHGPIIGLREHQGPNGERTVQVFYAWTQRPHIKAHVLITDQAIIYDAKHFGIRYFPLIAVEKIENGIMIVKCGKRYKFKLIYIEKNSRENEFFFNARVAKFAFDLLPLIILSLKTAISSGFAVGIDEKEIPKLPQKLQQFEQQYAELQKIGWDSQLNNVDAWIGLGFALESKKDFEGAVKAYQKALDIDPKSIYAWIDLGNALTIGIDDYDGAISAFHKAIALNPKLIDAWIGLGFAFICKEHFDGAIDAFHKTLEIDPKCMTAYNGLGLALMSKDDFDKSVETFRNAIGIDPKNADTWSGLGNALGVGKQNYDSAIDAFHKAIELKPKNPLAWVGLSFMLENKGDIKGANSAYSKASKIDPYFEFVRADLAESYLKKRPPNETITTYIDSTKSVQTPITGKVPFSAKFGQKFQQKWDIASPAIKQRFIKLGNGISHGIHSIGDRLKNIHHK